MNENRETDGEGWIATVGYELLGHGTKERHYWERKRPGQFIQVDDWLILTDPDQQQNEGVDPDYGIDIAHLCDPRLGAVDNAPDRGPLHCLRCKLALPDKIKATVQLLK